MTVLRSVCVIALLLVIASFAPAVSAQTGNASLSGRVTDPQGSVVPRTSVEAINNATNVKITSQSNSDGLYYFSALPPGSYRIVVSKDGFKQIIEGEVSLHTQDSLTLNFALQVGSVSETVTVNANTSSIESDNPAVSMTVDREFVENMPLNGRSFQDLIQLAPGTVNSANGQGYYSIDGQRQDANNFTVDGVSANLGGIFNTAGSDLGISGNSPSQTVLGTTQSLVSIDALQEFKIQTSGYTAEYGRNPGGQVGFTTRSGTNDIHGTLFEYLRNTAFDANSYQNNYYGEQKAPDHQNDYGGTVGGPLVIPKLYDGKDKTFFFFSYERLRLLAPASEVDYFPTQAFRNWASSSVQPYLDSVPLPNGPVNQDGCTIPDPATGLPTPCDAIYARSFSNPSNISSVSVRLDQNLGQRFHVFLRYADTPSSIDSSAGGEFYTNEINVHTWTAGLTANISSTLLNELRFNFSHDGEIQFQTQKAIGGSIPLARNLLIPTAYDSTYANGNFNAYVPGSACCVGSGFSGSGSVQHQYQVVDDITWTRGNHSLKFGGDWRRLTPTIALGTYSSTVVLQSLTAIQQGIADGGVTVSATAPGAPVFDNVSLFAQDHWRISPRLSIDYGLRWEFNPPPGPSNGHYPATLTSSDLATATLAPAGTQPYRTSYDHFAPRFGFAWNAIPSTVHALTVRGGFGIFYDTAQQTIGSAYFSTYPFQAYAPTLSNVPFPLSVADLAPPSLNIPLIPPYPYLNELTTPGLTLPYTEQWNLSVDEALNSKNTLTASYVGNEGKKLLFTGYYQGGIGIPINPVFAGGLEFTYNGSKSNYNALQVQDRGRIANGLDFVGSFTWAHSLDNASTNLGNGNTPVYGNSDNDLHEVLNLALNYQTSGAGSSRWERALTQGWLIANRFSAQSGYPLNIYQDEYASLPNGSYLSYFPDLVPGVPIYLHNVPGVPGGWKLNRAAFACTTTGATTGPCTGTPTRQGTLGRNYVRNPGFWALNTAVQRSFPIREQLHLIFRAEAFNILNHPNLGFPNTGLSNSTFGELANQITTIGVANQLYAMGASRSLQLSLKLQW